MEKKISITVRILPDGRTLTILGREAWAVRHLINAGEKGVTPIDTPGPRWSGYIFDLKAMGIQIETRHEKHGGPFPGNHARYVLKSKLEIIEEDKEAA